MAGAPREEGRDLDRAGERQLSADDNRRTNAEAVTVIAGRHERAPFLGGAPYGLRSGYQENDGGSPSIDRQSSR
jgi:hypothetical protein